MNMKKVLASVLAASMALSMAAVSASAAAIPAPALGNAYLYDEDGEIMTNATASWSGADVVIEGVRPNDTFYLWLGNGATVQVTPPSTGDAVNIKALADSDWFNFDNDKDQNSKLIKSASVETDLNKSGAMDNRDYVFVKFTMADSTMTSEEKITGTLEFKTRSEKNEKGSYGLAPGTALVSGDTLEIDYTIWMNNERVTNDDNPDTGDRVYYDPDSNEDNVLIWGDDRAALEFEADDDASKFYARLSTKSNSEIYAEYGDPVNADLYFYDFVGNPTIPSTSRATLTLGIPWDEDDDYVPDPEMCYIYEIDADGYLTDVTDLFTYSEDEQEIDGWSIRTRTLGTYVLSDTELDIEVYDDTDDTDDTTDDADTVTPGKEIPNTGANDMVNVAVVAAVVSLAAAGAVAFKKSSK